MGHIAYLGLGSNLQFPENHILRAFEELAALPHTRLTGRSRLYRSAPVGFLEQPDFINAVARLDTDLDAEALLDGLLAIELRHGRQRAFPNSPRTLDLDILLYDQLELSTPRLIIPHPRMGSRAFVLRPLQELAPELAIPGQGNLSALLARCAGQQAAPMETTATS